jgi:hypothetical protein
MDMELGKFLLMIKAVLMRAHLFPSGSGVMVPARARSISAAPALLAANSAQKQKQSAETVVALEKLKVIAEKLLNQTVADLLQEGRSKGTLRLFSSVTAARANRSCVLFSV